MIQETKSKWNAVTELMDQAAPVALGRYPSYWFYRTPRRMLHSQSYYKFAAKLIGKNKRVLDVGCNEGLGTYVLGKECGYALGVDFDEEAIVSAKKNFTSVETEFELGNILTDPIQEKFSAVTSFDVIEHIYQENVDQFWRAIQQRLDPQGLAVIGTPSLISQQFASAISKKGHVNVYAPERFEQEMNRYFEQVFLFAVNDEVVHTGFLPLAHYLIAVGCGVKK